MAKVFLLLLLLLTAETPSTAARFVSAPPPTSSSSYEFRGTVDPSFAVVVVALIVSFFLTGFLTICIRHFRESVHSRSIYSTTTVGGRLAHGLDPSVIESFPIYSYSEVKGGKGEGLLECAVCIYDFVDGDKLRMLPMCSHVFHPHCIDDWLVSRSTCPICRTNQSTQSSKTDGDGRCNVRTEENPDGEIRQSAYQVSIMVDSDDHPPSETNRNPARSVEKFPVSNSTGHSLTRTDLSTADDEVRIQVAAKP